MRQNHPVATITNDEITDISPQAPLYLQRTKNFNQWLEDRGADTNRSHIHKAIDYTLPVLSERFTKKTYQETAAEYPTDIPEEIIIKFCLNAYNNIVQAQNHMI